MSEAFSIVLPITKVDAAQRLVYSRAAQETPDRSREIMDYASARPEFEKWSAEIHAASGGKSYGNIRAMHGKVAAGFLLQPLSFDDAARAVDAVVKVVDDNEWNKVVAGVYTGLSIGGSYAKRWTDPTDATLTRYTPAPNEISLVDSPCIPTATFQLVKADGSTEDRAFQPGDTGVEQVWRAKDGSTFGKKADAIAHNEALAKTADNSPAGKALAALAALKTGIADLKKGGDDPGDGSKPYGDVHYADPGYQADKKKRYPLDTKRHIRSAWNYINKGKNAAKYSSEQLGHVKSEIVSEWKAKIDKDGPPSAEKVAAFGDLRKVANVLGSYRRDNAAALGKGMYHVACLARMLQEFADLEDAVEWEASVEGDGSELPAKMGMLIGSIGQLLREMVDEEVSEMAETEKPDAEKGERIIEAHDAEDPETMELAARIKGLAKVGRRNSAEDAARIQGMHDGAQMLGAKCDHGNADCPMDGKSAPAEALAKAEADRDANAAVLKNLTAEMEGLRDAVELLKRQPAVPRLPVRVAADKGVDGTLAVLAAPKTIRDQLAEIRNPAERAAFILSQTSGGFPNGR